MSCCVVRSPFKSFHITNVAEGGQAGPATSGDHLRGEDLGVARGVRRAPLPVQVDAGQRAAVVASGDPCTTVTAMSVVATVTALESGESVMARRPAKC